MKIRQLIFSLFLPSQRKLSITYLYSSCFSPSSTYSFHSSCTLSPTSTTVASPPHLLLQFLLHFITYLIYSCSSPSLTSFIPSPPSSNLASPHLLPHPILLLLITYLIHSCFSPPLALYWLLSNSTLFCLL